MSLVIRLLLTFCLLVLFGQSNAERARYDNYRVYKVISENKIQLQTLKELEGASDSLMFIDGVHMLNAPVNIVVAPHKIPDFLEILNKNEIKYELLEKNLQAKLDESDKQVPITPRDGGYNWKQYYELDATYYWLQTLAKQYPGVVTLIEGGKTYQGRSILGVKITKSKTQKPGIFLEAGIHAREWIAPATATYIINQLLTSNVNSTQALALNYTWYIFPHANPDGYVYTHTTDRMWRKTRTPYGACFGADPNRNWDFHWNEVGASSQPCSDTHAGPSPFSEIETLSLAQYIASLKGKVQLYISFHSYSQYLLYPYGHTAELPPNIDHFKQVFNVAVSAMSQRYNTKYTGGNIYDAIYPASGASVDWAYGTQNISMAFCYELRPSSSSLITGFKLPASQIIPTGEETLDSITAMVKEVKRLGYFL